MFKLRSVYIYYFVLISMVHLETLNDSQDVKQKAIKTDDTSNPKSVNSRFFDFGTILGNLFGSNLNQQQPSLGNGYRNPVFQPATLFQPYQQQEHGSLWDPGFSDSNQGQFTNQGSNFGNQGRLPQQTRFDQQRPDLNFGVQDQESYPNQGLQNSPSEGQYMYPFQNQGRIPYDNQPINQGQIYNQESPYELNQGQGQGGSGWNTEIGRFPNQPGYPTFPSQGQNSNQGQTNDQGSGFGNQGQFNVQGAGFESQTPLQQGQFQNEGQSPNQGQFNTDQESNFGNLQQGLLETPGLINGGINNNQDVNQNQGDRRPNDLSFLGITTESIPIENNFNDQVQDGPIAILGRPVIVPTDTTPVGQIVFNESSTENPAQIQCVQDCRTTSEYNPICGSNNVTYFNPARFMCARNCGVRPGNPICDSLISCGGSGRSASIFALNNHLRVKHNREYAQLQHPVHSPNPILPSIRALTSNTTEEVCSSVGVDAVIHL